MIALYTRVHVPHRSLYGRVVARELMPASGVIYRILVETDDGSHTEALYGSAWVRVAVDQRQLGRALPVPMVGLRLACVDGVAL